ncbi:hypothetical protein BU16DRAFT_534576 [Lophium mytilinum]|uniref:Uncharacterized protein n=1 Tax=Lophium mytilinum TaxID=390894 RepID=A0A6A6R6B0_9PEZI|nr:hypothetical protein BU16DRAFT_534576 [Lophium mytilinum]
MPISLRRQQDIARGTKIAEANAMDTSGESGADENSVDSHMNARTTHPSSRAFRNFKPTPRLIQAWLIVLSAGKTGDLERATTWKKDHKKQVLKLEIQKRGFWDEVSIPQKTQVDVSSFMASSQNEISHKSHHSYCGAEVDCTTCRAADVLLSSNDFENMFVFPAKCDHLLMVRTRELVYEGIIPYLEATLDVVEVDYQHNDVGKGGDEEQSEKETTGGVDSNSEDEEMSDEEDDEEPRETWSQHIGRLLDVKGAKREDRLSYFTDAKKWYSLFQ